MKKLILLTVLAIGSTGAWGDYSIKGEGNFSCPEYVSAKRSNTAKLYSSMSWVQGFITGMNYQRARDADTDSFVAQDIPAASIARWIENYCRENPADYVSDAAEAFVTENTKKE
jgi:hypothetical protein